MATKSDYVLMIQNELPVKEEGEISALIDTYWELYSDKTLHEQYLYTKRHVLTTLMGKYSTAFNITVGTDKLEFSRIFNQLSNLRGVVDGELKELDPHRGSYGILTVTQVVPQ